MTWSSEVLADSPYLWWKFEETTGTNADDSSPNNRDGTYVNSPTLGQPGAVNLAAFFDGTTDEHVRSTTLLNTPTVTVESWIYITGTPTVNENIGGFLDGYGSGVLDKLLFVAAADRGLYFYIFDTAGRLTSAPTSIIPTNQWVHVAGTADGSNIKTYMNGNEVGSATAGNTFTGYTVNNIFVCGEGSGGSQIDGPRSATIGVDEFVVYTNALSSRRILKHFSSRFGEETDWSQFPKGKLRR